MALPEGPPRLSPARQYIAMSRQADLLDRYRREIFYLLAVLGAVFLVPTANHFVQGRVPQGLATLTLNIALLVNAWCYYRKRPPLVQAWVILVPALSALVLAIRVQGDQGVLWAYPAILLFHFLASRLVANIFNFCIVAIVVPVSWAALGPSLAVRVGVTMVLVIVFTNIFSYIAETQQRKEAEQRRELDEQARQLQAQNEALREAIRMREELERIARHDLKTPLASIASVPRLLREGRTPDARESELLAMVEGAALRVLSMLNLSLDLYRMEEGRYTLRSQAVDLRAVVRTVARELRAHAESKGARLVLDLPAGMPAAQGDELLCYSIIANLARNAVEASPDGGEITISLAAGPDGTVELDIHNAGAVPEAVRERFFEKYATHGKTGGTGLGTYSARLMAQVQHGDLRMATSEDAGTLLVLQLPAWQREGSGATMPAPLEQALPLADAALPPLSVLLVDDDEYNVMVLRNLLPSPPLHVRVAVNGRAAVDAVAAQRPDVVFLDLEMPVMGGVEALERIRALQARRGEAPSRVVAFSAHDDSETRGRCRAAGFDLYLTKPASRDEVLAVLLGVPAQASQPAALAPSADGMVDVDAELLPLLPGFLVSRRALVQDLLQALDGGDRGRVRELAHKLAGSLALYGLAELAGQACALERGAPLGDAADLRKQAADLLQRLADVRARARPVAPSEA